MSKFEIVQENYREIADKHRVKNTRKELAQQEQQMQRMAMVSHERSCEIFNCPTLDGKARFCFKPAPDILAKDTYEPS
jgi:hypothetical protein